MECVLSKIPQIITPGDDNDKNRFWVIEYNAKYPKVEVSIYNRWGSLVYKSNGPYKDDWDGKSNVNGSIGTGVLPSGTYYYIVDKLADGTDVESGFLEIIF